MSVPLPAAVAAALVLAIGLALTATLSSLTTTGRAEVPNGVPTSSLEVARPATGLRLDATDTGAGEANASLQAIPAMPVRKPLI